MQELRHEEQLKRQREQEEYDREMAILESQYQQKLQAEHDAELRAAEQLRNSQQSRLRQEKLQELRRQQDANQKLREEQRRLNLHKTSANEETSDSGKTRNLYEETYTYDESGTLREHKVLQDNRASHPSLQPQKPKLSTTGRTGQIVFTRDADGNLVAERTSYINKDGQQVDKLLNEQELDEETPTEKDFGTSGEIEEESSSESEESSDSNTDESGTESEDESELFTNVNNLASDVDQFINEQYYDRSFSIVGTPSGFNIDKVKYYYNKKPSTELIRSGEIPPIKSADRVYMDNMGTKGYYDVIQFVKNGVLHRKIEISESQKQCSDPDRDYLAGDETQQRPVASVQLEKDKYNLAAPTVQAQTQQSSTTPHTSTPVRKDPSAETIQRENKQFEDNFDEEAFAKKNPELFRAFEFSKKIGSVQEYNDVLHYYYDEKPVKSMPLIRGIIRAKDFTYNSKNYQAFDFQVNGRYYRKIDELPKKLTDHEVFMKVNIPCYGHNLNERQNKLLYFEDAMDKKWQDDDSRTVQISYVFEKIQPYQTDDEVYKFIDFEYDNGKRCRKVEKISRTEIPEFLLKSGLSELYNNKYIVLPMHKTSIYGDHRIHSKVKIEDNRGFNDKYMLLLHREHKDNEPHYYLKYAVKDGSGYYPYKKNK